MILPVIVKYIWHTYNSCYIYPCTLDINVYKFLLKYKTKINHVRSFSPLIGNHKLNKCFALKPYIWLFIIPSTLGDKNSCD